MNSFYKLAFFLLFSLNTFIITNVYSQALETPIEKCNYTSVTSYSEMMSFLDELVRIEPTLKIKTIGKSVQGREIPMIHFANLDDNNKIRVLVFCQQHGNEPSGKEAVLALLKEILSSKSKPLFANIDLYLIPSVNPDGNESGKRYNANDSDLNRNHQILTEPEVISLHNIFNEINPDVTLDVHEYSAYRRSFKEVGYVRSVDEQFGAPTNLNVSKEIIDYSLNKLFPFIENYLKEKSITFSNYYKMNDPSDTVRASTTGITDGRQSFAILNKFSFILEGKNGPKANGELKRRTLNQLEAIKGFLNFVDLNASSIKSLVKNQQDKLISLTDSVVVQMDYLYDGSTIDIAVEKLGSKLDSAVTMKYSPDVVKLKSVDRPISYIIPKNCKEVIDFLNRNHISYNLVEASCKKPVQIYTVNDVENNWLENKVFKIITTTSRIENVELEKGDIVVPVKQVANNFICISLEPESMWGIVQYEQFANLIEIGKDYPILRIISE